MSITITLPVETEEKLRKQAAASGMAVDALACDLLKEILDGGEHETPSRERGAALDKVLAPFRKEVQESAMTDEALKQFFTEVRDEVRSEKRAKRA